MKRLFLIAAAVVISWACTADNRPVTLEQLPSAAKLFIEANYPGENISYAYSDDDRVRPDYTVRLSNGVEIQFEHDGSLEKISARAGVPAGVVPVQITDYVKAYYPDALVIEYEVGRREYEVKLSNGLELQFNASFRLKDIDD